MRKSKNRYFYHIFVYPGDAPGAITLNVVWMEREFDAYKLSRWSKSWFFHTPLHSTPPLGGFPSEYRHPLWDGKTRMVSLPDGEKNFQDMFIRFDVIHEREGQTDGQTDTAWQQRPRLCIASRGKKQYIQLYCCYNNISISVAAIRNAFSSYFNAF